MKNYTILLISILLLLFVNKTAVEGFISEQGTCIVGSNQYEELKSKIESINFDEIKLKLFTITRRVDEIEDKMEDNLERNKKKSLKVEEDEDEDVEEGSSEVEFEESLYEPIISQNKNIYDNYLITGLIVIFAIILFLFLIYFLYRMITQFNKSRRLNIKKIDLSYNDILDELKKNKIKGKIKLKSIQK